jgi:ATP-dependent DNA ligase
MLAKPAKGIPDPAKFPDADHPGLLFEPKWDGFRCVVFKDGNELELTSRNTKSLTRYFPDVVAALSALLPDRCVLDGELVVAVGERLEFDRLQDRIHPAASRVKMLAETLPAAYVAFDLLALGDEDLTQAPLAVRRARLETALADVPAPLHLTPATRDPELAAEWFDQFEGAGLDGVMAKALAAPYSPNGRTMIKVKHDRTADCVVAGYRLHKTSTEERPLLGSLLLGLYDAHGTLHHVGVSASFTAVRRAELVDELRPLVVPLDEHPWSAWQTPGENTDRLPGGVSRWSGGKDLSFTPLRPDRVVEVGYDHMEGDRFRHTATFKRWRPDRDAGSCNFDQLEEPVSYDLGRILGTRPND